MITTPIAPAPTASQPLAAMQALLNFQSNLSALNDFQPDLAAELSSVSVNAEWLFARDGYLSAQVDQQWLSACSIPLLAGRQFFKKLDLVGTLGCFLLPKHAAQLRAVFEKISPTQAILAVIPQPGDLATLLHCDDFRSEISAARLFFATGADWPQRLGNIFRKFPGLPLPQQFLRTPLLDDAEMGIFTEPAQRIISTETARRADRLSELASRTASPASGRRTLVLASSVLNLSDLSNIALRKALADSGESNDFIAFDSDHPLTAAPLALAEAAANASAVVAADFFRVDLPGVVPPHVAWITWVTSGRVAPCDPAYPNDAVLLADPVMRAAALKAGWPTDRIALAGWPHIIEKSTAAAPTHPTVAFLASTIAIEPPEKAREISSQLLLWEYIAEELAANPLALGRDPERYLDSRRQRFEIPDQTVDRALFLNRLLIPAYQQRLARLAIKNGVHLVLIGAGWQDQPEFAPNAAGSPKNIAELERLLAPCQLLLESFPTHRSVSPALPLPTLLPADLPAISNPSKLQKLLRQPTRDASTPTLNPSALNAFLPR